MTDESNCKEISFWQEPRLKDARQTLKEHRSNLNVKSQMTNHIRNLHLTTVENSARESYHRTTLLKCFRHRLSAASDGLWALLNQIQVVLPASTDLRRAPHSNTAFHKCRCDHNFYNIFLVQTILIVELHGAFQVGFGVPISWVESCVKSRGRT